MPKGVCPAPGEVAESSTAVDNGAVLVTILWTGNGTSTFPACDGPVQSIRTVNTTALDYYAHLPQKARGSTVVAIPAGSDTTLTGNALRQAGLDLYSAAQGVVIDTNPNAV